MVQALPFDNTYVNLPDRFFARLDPQPVKAPQLVALNDDLAAQLGLDAASLRSTEGLNILAGNEVAEGSQPLAMAYAGQQFGNWVPQLGDGRALLLGEVVDQDGVRFDVQLKGSGPTPFSRRGDGRAWLGPVMREYLVSEAMFALGVPTTRSLAAVTTGETVVREGLFPGAVLTRIARSHIRVGTFQYFAARQDWDGLKTLSDYATERLFPELQQHENSPFALLQKVINDQADLIARWMSIGFIHGVMNTDNVSISGETIDYGPCAFMDEYKAQKVFSSIDEMGRYSFSNQPRIGHWNMVQFAQAILPVLHDDQEKAVELAQAAVNAFPDIYMVKFQSLMNRKLGLGEVLEGDVTLGRELLNLMEEQEADFTRTFRALAVDETLPQPFKPWLEKWQARRADQTLSAQESRQLMEAANPAIIPRNPLIEAAIAGGLDDDFDLFHQLHEAFKAPFVGDLDAPFAQPPKQEEIVRYTFCGT